MRTATLIYTLISLIVMHMPAYPQKNSWEHNQAFPVPRIGSLKSDTISMCAKLPMAADGIIRLSKVEVDPVYLDEYIKFAAEVGEISLCTEPGVLTMYALQEKDNPCNITILETYASREAYRSHIASAHFQKYKQGTLHMVKVLQLTDQNELNPTNRVLNYIE